MDENTHNQEIENMTEEEAQAHLEARVAVLIEEMEVRMAEFIALTNENGKVAKKRWRKLRKSRSVK